MHSLKRTWIVIFNNLIVRVSLFFSFYDLIAIKFHPNKFANKIIIIIFFKGNFIHI